MTDDYLDARVAQLSDSDLALLAGPGPSIGPAAALVWARPMAIRQRLAQEAVKLRSTLRAILSLTAPEKSPSTAALLDIDRLAKEALGAAYVRG